jgi:hypothetical protein
MTYKSKFRVFVEKYCRKCKVVHQQPTHRYIFHQAEGTADEVRQRAHAYAVVLLRRENRAAKAKNLHQRPLWQYDITVEA